MVNEAIVRRLANNVQGYLTQLRQAQDIDHAKFLADIRAQRFVERTLQMAVEAVLDIVHHIIGDEGYREPESYADAFSVLQENGVISAPTAACGRLMAQFRNKVVHNYATVDPEQVYAIFAEHLGDFEAFLHEIDAWLRPKGRSGPGDGLEAS